MIKYLMQKQLARERFRNREIAAELAGAQSIL